MTHSSATTTLPISADTRTNIISKLAEELQAKYVFPDVAQRIGEELHTRLQHGAYDTHDDGYAFCAAVTKDLQEIGQDKHLRINTGTNRVPTDPEVYHKQVELNNYSFYKIERLPGNVGLLDLRGFESPQLAGDTLVAAMNLLANTSVLIIDVRKNGGGHPDLVALLISYLYEAQPVVHLNSFYLRMKDELSHTYTLPYVPGKRYGSKKPVYVLTSDYTFSAAEEFCYDLQNLKRAKLFGQTTRGGANPGMNFPIIEGYEAFIPTGRAINPISKTNWEGVGVKPDVACSAEEAFELAYREALQYVMAHTDDSPVYTHVLREAKEELEKL